MRARARDVARDVGVDAAQVGVESALGALEVEHGDVDVGDGDAARARRRDAHAASDAPIVRAPRRRGATRAGARVTARSDRATVTSIGLWRAEFEWLTNVRALGTRSDG